MTDCLVSSTAIVLSESEGWKYYYHKNVFHNEGDQPAVISPTGLRMWYRYGLRHRDHDQPAVIQPDGMQEWYQRDQLHRDDDKPALVRPGVYKTWYQRGHRHRGDDQPAYVHSNGMQVWYWNGLEHRENDMPSTIHPSAERMEWRVHGLLHRDGDNPARIEPGLSEWYQRGRCHRDGDKPAVISETVWLTHVVHTRQWCTQGVIHHCSDYAVESWREPVEEDERGDVIDRTTHYYWFGTPVSRVEHTQFIRSAVVLKRALLRGQTLWRWRIQRWSKRMVGLSLALGGVRDVCELVVQYTG